MFTSGKRGLRAPVRRQSIDEEEVGKAYNHTVVRRMGEYIRPHLWSGLLVLVTMFIYTGTVVALPKVIQTIIDDYVTVGDMSGLIWVVVIFFGIAITQLVTEIIHRRLMSKIGQRILYKMRNDMFVHLQRLSMSFYDRNEAGKVMSRIQNDVNQLQNMLGIVVTTLADLLSLVGIIAVMVWMDPLLAGLTLTVVPALVGIMLWWQKFAKRIYSRARLAMADVNAGLQENIAGARVIQSMSREDVNRVGFFAANRENMAANISASRYSAILGPAVNMLSAVSLGIVVAVGGTLAIRGTVEVGVILAFALYIERFFEPVQSLTGQYASLQRAMVAGERIFQLLDVKPDVVEKPDAIDLPVVRGEIYYDDVEFYYNPDTPVLRGINLRGNAGETVALVGPTGAGKTSLVSLLMRMYDVTSGAITVDGYDIRDVTSKSLSKQLSVVPQEPYLFSGMTLRENIRYNRLEVTDEEIERATKAVGAHEFIMKMGQGYDTVMQERGGNLSTGQRQLISFARALVGNPRILLLDEATANIDTHTESLIQKALNEMLKGRTALIIAHRLSTIRNADKIVVVDKGRIAEQGNHEQLIAKNGMYAHLSSLNMVGEEV